MIEYYTGEEVVEFVSYCPVDGCTNFNLIHWKHDVCSSKEYINGEGYIICPKCNKKWNFFDFKFNCGVHENNKPPARSSQTLIRAFAVLGRVGCSGEKIFVKKLLNSLIDQCDD